MAEPYSGEYGYPYPRVDEYGNPVAPVDQYGTPIPREPGEQPAYSSGATAPSHGTSDVTAAAPAGYATGVAVAAPYPHEGAAAGVVSPAGAAAYTQQGPVSGSLAPGETTLYAYDGSAAGITTEPTTMGETLRRSGSSSSSSSVFTFFLPPFAMHVQ